MKTSPASAAAPECAPRARLGRHEGEGLPDPGAGGARDRGAEHHRRTSGAGAPGGIRGGEGREVDAVIAGARRFQLAAERRVGSLEQHLDITAREHRRHVAGSGRTQRAIGTGSDLNGDRRRGKTCARERAARGLRLADEMADVIEENLVENGKLTVRR